MNKLQKRLLDNVMLNNGMYTRTSIENDFLLFSTLIFKYSETYVLMQYFNCSKSKVSKVRNGLQNYSKNDLKKLNELHILYKNYINEFKHIFDRVM